MSAAEDVLWSILTADPAPGLPRTTLHISHDERPHLVIYYTRIELSENEAETLQDLILERSIR